VAPRPAQGRLGYVSPGRLLACRLAAHLFKSAECFGKPLVKKLHHHAACIALFKRSARQNMSCFNCLAPFFDDLLYKITNLTIFSFLIIFSF
jgi:hypothetical protein